jgi:hypothetical protein
MRPWVARLGLSALLVAGVGPGAALGSDLAAADPPATTAARAIPDLHLSVGETAGEVTLRLPVASEHLLYGLVSPYLSVGSGAPLGARWANAPAAGLRRDVDAPDELRLGAGMALPISGRAELYGEYRFLRGRLDATVGRDLLQREPDSGDFRAGFSVRFD